MSRGVHRGVYSALVDDLDFQRLSPRARHVFLTLRLSKEVGPACIFVFYPEIVARQSGYSRRQIEAAMAELEQSPDSEHPWVRREGPLVWLRNALRHDPSMRLANEHHLKAVERWVNGLPRVNLVLTFCAYYKIGKPSAWPVNGIAVPLTSEYRIPNTEDRVPITDLGVASGKPSAPTPAVLRAEDQKFLDSLPDPYRVQWLTPADWWVSLGDGYPGVNLQIQASRYIAYRDGKPVSQQHKNVREAFRAWVAKAARWREQDEMRNAVKR